MHDFRNSTALCQPTDLGREPDSPDWAWAVAHLEPSGRLLPFEARAALGAGTAAWRGARDVLTRRAGAAHRG
jgi:hypothetical protein